VKTEGEEALRRMQQISSEYLNQATYGIQEQQEW
jgi:hypothetical protein